MKLKKKQYLTPKNENNLPVSSIDFRVNFYDSVPSGIMQKIKIF